MDDWTGWEDPAELRVRLDVALEEIAGLREENTRLRALLGPVADSVPARDADGEAPPQLAPELVVVVPQMLSSSGLPYADASSGGREKLALFRALFVGRSDVFARPWVNKKGRSGWSPATEKPPWELREDEERVLLPLSDQALYDHLTRPEPGTEKKFEKLHAGLYPLLEDDTCQLLAFLRTKRSAARIARLVSGEGYRDDRKGTSDRGKADGEVGRTRSCHGWASKIRMV